MDLLNLKPNIISEALSEKIFLFYGEPGSRKTSVSAEFDDSLIAAFEIGYKFISGAVAQPIQNWADFKKFLRELKKDEVKDKFQTIVIDTISLAYSACSEYVCTSMGINDPSEAGYGKAYRAIRKEFEKSILSIPQMGYGLIMIAHADEMEEGGVIKSKADIDKRPAAIIKGLADFIFYLRKEYKDNDESDKPEQTVYAYSKLVEIETKTRSRYFSPRFEFTFDNLQLEMKKAIEEQKKVEGAITVKAKSSLHEIEELDFEQFQMDVITLAQRLLTNPTTESAVRKIISELFDIKLSQTEEFHRPKLEILYSELLEIESQTE